MVHLFQRPKSAKTFAGNKDLQLDRRQKKIKGEPFFEVPLAGNDCFWGGSTEIRMLS